MTETHKPKNRRPKLFLPPAPSAPKPAGLPLWLAPGELRRLVAAMVD